MFRKILAFVLALSVLCCLGGAAFAQESTRHDELAELEKRAESGEAEAMCALGMEILQMQKASQEDWDEDCVKAWEWFKKSAEQEFPEAYNWLGYMCESGCSPETDVSTDAGYYRTLEMAMEYYRKGTELGNAECMTALGGMLGYHPSVTQDEAAAKSLFESAAALGEPNAIASLGLMYHYGSSVTPQDYGKAVELYEKAGDMGLISVLETLADMYYMGEGVPQDMEKYTEYYERARTLKGEELERERQARIYFRGQ